MLDMYCKIAVIITISLLIEDSQYLICLTFFIIVGLFLKIFSARHILNDSTLSVSALNQNTVLYLLLSSVKKSVFPVPAGANNITAKVSFDIILLICLFILILKRSINASYGSIIVN